MDLTLAQAEDSHRNYIDDLYNLMQEKWETECPNFPNFWVLDRELITCPREGAKRIDFETAIDKFGELQVAKLAQLSISNPAFSDIIDEVEELELNYRLYN